MSLRKTIPVVFLGTAVLSVALLTHLRMQGWLNVGMEPVPGGGGVGDLVGADEDAEPSRKLPPPTASDPSLDGNIDALKKPRLHSDSNGLHVNFENMEPQKKSAIQSRMAMIGRRGMCSVHRSCAACLANPLCSWCAQGATGSTGQQCLPNSFSCDDRVTMTCEVSLLRREGPSEPQPRNICIHGAADPEAERSIARAADVWGYPVVRAGTAEAVGCAPLNAQGLAPPLRRSMNEAGWDTVLCNTVQMQRELQRFYAEDRDVRPMNILLATGLEDWEEKARGSGFCVVDAATNQLLYSRRAILAGCYAIAVSSPLIENNPTENVIPPAYVFKSSAAMWQHLQSASSSNVDVYDAFLKELHDAEVTQFRHVVRRALAGDVHIVALAASEADLSVLLTFVTSTLVQLPMASLEIQLCPTVRRSAFPQPLRAGLEHLQGAGVSVAGQVRFTDVEGAACDGRGSALTHAPKVPQPPPPYVLYVASMAHVVLTADLVSVLATQQRQAGTPGVMLPGVAVLIEEGKSRCRAEVAASEAAGAAGKKAACVHSGPWYTESRVEEELQLFAHLNDADMSLDRLAAVMLVVQKLRRKAWYTDEFQQGMHPLLRFHQRSKRH